MKTYELTEWLNEHDYTTEDYLSGNLPDHLESFFHEFVFLGAEENVMRGRRPTYSCKYGHFGCTFSPGDACTNERIHDEYEKLLDGLKTGASL